MASAFGVCGGYFSPVLLQELFLHGLRESVDGVTRLGFARRSSPRVTPLPIVMMPFAADEAEAGGLAGAVDEIHAQGQVECRVPVRLRVIVQARA